jgi:hypothetical protein
VLGKRRLIAYPLVFAAVALVSLAVSGYMLVEVVAGRNSGWTLLVLPGLLFLVLYCGTIGIAGVYFVATGRRWTMATRIGNVLVRLNSNV